MKKRYVLNHDDQQHNAVVATDGTETMVQVGEGPLHQADYLPVLGGRAISLRLNGRMHLVHITGLDSKGNVTATIDGRPVHMTVMDELKAQALESLGSAAGSGTISADIPGLVVEIKVSEGQVVHQGEPVIVVEAMKMQNELCAAVAGTVTSIPVGEGQSVNPGDPLVIIEPEPGG
jgi:biotin carboxyl carrier protein